MTTFKTQDDIYRLSADAYEKFGGSSWPYEQKGQRHPGDVIDSAIQNANDTVYVEKAREESEWVEMALGSLSVLLSERDIQEAMPKGAVKWFQKQGISW